MTNSLLELATIAREEHRSQQKPAELVHLAQLVEDSSLSIALEIGTYSGGTAWFLSKIGMKVTAVDQSLANLMENNRGMVNYVEMSSADYAAEDIRFDLVFIDGDHSYEGVKADFEAYYPKVTNGGVLVLHDITVHAPVMKCYVSDLWAEIKGEYPTSQWIEEPTDWGGIGAVFR